MKKNLIILLAVLFSIPALATVAEKPVWSHVSGRFEFQWDIAKDQAKTLKQPGGQTIWEGSLLPAFLLEDVTGKQHYVKATAEINQLQVQDADFKFILRFDEFGTGELLVKKTEWGISFEKLSIHWTAEPPKIISMYIGTSLVPEEGQAMMPVGQHFIGNFRAAGFCVPGAKEGPAQSYFRMWDFGQSTIPLGSFGPTLGAPYGAAFPRPVLAFAMGNDQGWTAFGAGSLPDAPMVLKLQSSMGCIEFLYREDLWGAGQQERVWRKPLCITFGENAWLAFRGYFHSFPEKEPLSNVHQKAIWNTWGNWRNKEYPIRPMVDFAKQTGTEVFVVDDPWEESQGLGKPSTERFPDFQADLDYIEKSNMQRGIWETLGWIKDTAACGLTKNDLIVGKDGKPSKASWNFNPFDPGYFCIDISSAHAREFLKERTIWTMKNIQPKLIKLDFGYGMPSPDRGVPRNPELRGERYCFELMKIISKAAKSVDPDVTIMYYGISPLFLPVVDMVSLDDQGDLWYAVKEGHDQWSIWASLLSDQQVAISGSSGYDWHKDDEVVLNSFILGSPGAVLATHLDDGSPVPEKYLNRRLALNTWFRKTVQWEPVWLNSHLGGLTGPPQLKCWGRQEKIDGKDELTALVLSAGNQVDLEELKPFEWEGRWALVSQTGGGILNTSQLAVIPFDAGFISIQLTEKPKSIQKLSIDGNSPFTDWKWENGKLTIRVNEAALSKTAGYMINRLN